MPTLRLRFSAVCLMSFISALSIDGLFCQSASYTLSGFVQDASSGEQLLGATIWHAQTQSGTSANAYGHYSISLPVGEQEVLFSYLGYTPVKMQVDMTKDIKLDVDLTAGFELGEAVIEAGISESIEEQVQMSKIEVPIEQIKRLPAIAGEVDLLKSLQKYVWC